ncbi:MAG: transcriptional repressor [Actinobacteria bacterium]|nr:transcriptional repressor [Actinomycetota bacterium]
MPDLHDTAGERLRADNQRYTTGRRAIVDALAAAEGPLTMQELLDACDGLAQSSAYRNLTVLERNGVVRRLSALDEFTRYELAEAFSEHHHHLVCGTCGRIEDFVMPPSLEASLEAGLDSVAAAHGFGDVTHELDLVGTCGRCSASNTAPPGALSWPGSRRPVR